VQVSLTAPPTPTATPVNVGMVSMVDALKQFDANGQPVAGNASMQVGTTVALNTGLQPKNGIDILAPSK
jgi:hypothetical protein